MEDTIEELGANVSIVATYKGRETNEDGWEHDAWTVTLTYQGRTYKDIAYRMGTGHSKPYPTAKVRADLESWRLQQEQKRWEPTPPTASSVIDSLLLDVSGLDQRFEDWATDYGFDEDSRKAERFYNECLKVLPRLRALLGSDFDRFERAERL